MTETVTADEYRAELRKQKQMPKEKTELDQFLRQRAWETEHRFHPTRRWRFDYAAPAIKVAVEYDGLYGGGAHTSVKMVAKDSEKLNQAAILGWLVIRVNAASLRDGSGYLDIERAVAIRELAEEEVPA